MSTMPESAPTVSPASLRPSRIVNQTVPSDATTDGSRAVNESTLPKGSENKAMSQKNNGGLSVVTSPLT